MDGRCRKEENTMAVEIAIQRELAHRKKVAAPHLRSPNSNSTKEVFPLQVKSPSQASKSIPLPGSTPRLSLSQHLSGIKRKKTLVNAEADNSVYCKICQVSCSSPFNLKQHLIGHKHREKLLELESGEKAGTSESNRCYERQWCDICKVSCMNEELLKLHFQGKKHKAQLQRLEFDQQGGVQLQNKQQKWCELCKLRCIDEFSFEQHLQGRKHILQLHAMEKEKNKLKEKDPLIL
ncbi:UBP1-associated proteins 1C-like [Arachis stenosperma]|uniref:UBP1-associated proteins 1C-like n=1 Tax=Arachis stenosperma TaxID=217475 RepID=UPI0025AD9C5F|nr:UBP1-associated proteins 1C-like [Arachis stenosperma]